MSLRWKLLLLLLVISIAPLVAVTVADHWALRNLGERLGAAARQHQLQDARQDLLFAVNSLSQLIETESQFVGALLWLQAKAVEDVLPQPAGARSPGDEPPAIASSLLRVRPVLEAIARGNVASERILRQYVVLDDGSSLILPDGEQFDEGFDPRSTAWYRSYRDDVYEPIGSGIREMFWYSQSVDPVTRRFSLMGLRKIRDANGDPVGVTAIEVSMDGVFTAGRLPRVWSQSGRMMLVSMLSAQELSALGLPPSEDLPLPVVFIDQQMGAGLDRPGQPRRLYELPLHGAARERFRSGVQAFEPDVLPVTQDGETAVWAYASLTPLTAIVFAVPASRVQQHVAETQEAVWSETIDLLRASSIVFVVVVALLVLVAWRGARAVTVPVQAVARTAEAIAGGELDARVELGRRVPDELTRLASAFNRMVPKLRDQMAVRQSLQLAMEVQQSLLPQDPPRVPGLDIAGHSLYCDETGGDYYDFLQLDETSPRTLLIAVGDVVGHGVAAALLMATARALLRSRAESPGELGEVVSDVNRHLCQGRFTGRFMTLMLMQITTHASGGASAQFVAAGHDPAVVYDPRRNDFTELHGQDIPLGVENDWSYTTHSTAPAHLRAGQVLVLGTDGIWEARNAAGEMFGKDRLREVIGANAARPAQTISVAIQQAVSRFRGPCAQADDITLVVVKMVDA